LCKDGFGYQLKMYAVIIVRPLCINQSIYGCPWTDPVITILTPSDS
jgi:hypothetical protein